LNNYTINLRGIMSWATVILLTANTLVLGSCASNTGTGVLAGGVIGAGVGGIAGGGGGALIGGAAGIIAGGLIGAGLDEHDRKVMERSSPRTVDRMDKQEPLTINDIIKLTQSGIKDEVVIEYMQSTESSYNLSRTQIRRLQDAGVSQEVIHYMMNTSK
jgi:outer membrane lipoprotein SlyB